jgi:general stress protein YciG
MAGISGTYIYDKEGNVIGATGAKLAAFRNLQRDPDFYRTIGKRGGTNGVGKGGFKYMAENDPERLRALSIKGGTKSRKNKKTDENA